MNVHYPAAISSSRRRRRLSRVAALTVALGTAVALAACSSPATGGGGDLRFMTLEGEQSGAQVLIDAYSATDGAVKVTPEYTAGDGYNAALRTQLTSGTAPDIFEVAPGNGNPIAIDVLAPGNYLTDLSSQPWVGKIPEGVKGVTQVDGKTLFLPITGGVFGMLYNTDIFTQQGLTPPTTWSELLDVCAKLKAAGILPIAMGNSGGGYGSLFLTYQMAASTTYAADPNWAQERTDGKVTFADSGWGDALTKFVQLNKLGYFGDSPNGTASEDSQQAFATGKAGMIAIVSQQLGGIEKSAGGDGPFSSFPFPAVDDADSVWVAAGPGYGYAVNAATKNPDAALAFLAKAAEPAQVKAFNLALGGIPLLPSDDGAVPDALTPLVPFVQNGHSATYMDQLWPNADVQTALVKGCQELLGGTKTVDQVLADMDAAFDK